MSSDDLGTDILADSMEGMTEQERIQASKLLLQGPLLSHVRVAPPPPRVCAAAVALPRAWQGYVTLVCVCAGAGGGTRTPTHRYRGKALD